MASEETLKVSTELLHRLEDHKVNRIYLELQGVLVELKKFRSESNRFGSFTNAFKMLSMAKSSKWNEI
jgi:hypothetical protein